MIDAGQLQGQQPGAVAPDQQDGPVLAAAVILFVGHPRPHHFPRIGVFARHRRIADLRDPPVVAGVVAGPAGRLRRAGGLRSRCA